MFTGIIGDLGQVEEASGGAMTRFVIGTRFDSGSIALGASIACNGVCLSAVDVHPGAFAVEVSAETLAMTTLGSWQRGTAVNLERALRAGDELGGHLVSGHVDGVATIVERRQDGGSVRYVVEVPRALALLIAPKGSVALDGVSLTVNEVAGSRFGVNIIPLTQRLTTFGTLEVGAKVNLETDLLARYLARLLEQRAA